MSIVSKTSHGAEGKVIHFLKDGFLTYNYVLFSHTSFMLGTKDQFKDPSNASLSFMLAKDHGLDSATHLCFVNIGNLILLHSMKNVFQNCERKIISIKTPFSFSSTVGSTPAGLVLKNCLEFENRYELAVSVQQSLNIINGN